MSRTLKARRSETGARLLVTEEPGAAVDISDFLYTDVWVSMGEPESIWEERIKLLTAETLSS